VDGTQISVLEKSHQVGLSGFLQSQDCGGLKSQICLEFLGDFPDESLERKLSQKEISRFLIFSDFSQGNCTWSKSVGFLDPASGWGGFPCGL